MLIFLIFCFRTHHLISCLILIFEKVSKPNPGIILERIAMKEIYGKFTLNTIQYLEFNTGMLHIIYHHHKIIKFYKLFTTVDYSIPLTSSNLTY